VRLKDEGGKPSAACCRDGTSEEMLAAGKEELACDIYAIASPEDRSDGCLTVVIYVTRSIIADVAGRRTVIW
jgi:hypothetical protein